MIDADGPAGRWPQEPSPYRCQECPDGPPVRYVLLPPSDLIAAEGSPYNRPVRVEVDGNEVRVVTLELVHTPFHVPVRWYRFSRLGVPLGYAMGDGFDEAHESFEAAGRLGHPAAECPDIVRPVATRTWTPEAGWQPVRIPVDPVNPAAAR